MTPTPRFRWNRESLSRDLRSAAVALFVSVLVLAAPSVAAKITNADAVDGKSAVGAGASVKKRAGKLVATNGKGRLPGNIIAKAPDANALDGLDSTALVPRNAKAGSVQSGLWSAWGGNATGYVADAVTLPSRLPADLPMSRVTYLNAGAAMTAECPGLGRVGPTGWACFYELNRGGVTFGNIFNQDQVGGGASGVSRDGFGIYYTCSSDSCYAYGRWAVKAPAPTAARQPGRPARRSNP
ncbi:hypothetical protein [Nocardioides sp. cx-173]|uniref:hypothetical protein n=1 Tax=Nocardioides sp. cx-173 TaxID=2898796 RepID=UPI001E4A7FD0|nr:hypothetical protein [Nocardioides sp. cx-173]MCD4525108.1 hypothetical protein [Nocardioides sp. cx-173]UGB40189.1 hypothetical protein LQ940_12385 [Nocardioides sp. cx-173]